MLRNIIFHKLKGIPKTKRDSTNIDVSFITEVYHRKRPFMIFNRDHPYFVRIWYKRYPHLFMLDDLLFLNEYHYKNEQECIDDIKEIIDKQNKLKVYTEKIKNKILNK